METRRLVPFVSIALLVLFPDQLLYILLLFTASEFFYRYRDSRQKNLCDKLSVELLFTLSSCGELTEQIIANEMMGFSCFNSFSQRFNKTSKLLFPNFGWRSYVVASAIRSALDTGNTSILTLALEQISKREESITETQSVLVSQKYTLIASIAVSSAILGVTANMSGQSYLLYVFLQSLLSSLWLWFLGTGLYESVSLSIPLSITAYLCTNRFV